MTKRVCIEEIPWVEFDRLLAANRDLIVMLPVGSTEQHGPHLPLGTDSINVDHLCIDAAKREDDVYVLPCVRYGIAHNHIDFRGTITLEPETLIAMVVEILRSLHRHGVRRMLIVNGHGGNNATLDVAAIKARKELPDALIGHCYSGALAAKGNKETMESGIDYHADESETSRTLALRPDLVKIEAAKRDVTPAFESYYHRYYKSGADMLGLVSYGLPPTICLSTSGIMGDASKANVEKGRKIVTRYLESLAKVLADLRAAPMLKPLR